MSTPGPIVLKVERLGFTQFSVVTVATPDHGQAEIMVPTAVIDTQALRVVLAKWLAARAETKSALETEV